MKFKFKKTNKKYLLDQILIPIFLLVCLIIVVSVKFAFLKVSEIEVFKNQTTTQTIFNHGKTFFSGLDYILLFLLFSINLYSLIMLFIQKSHPILFVIHFILIPITIYVSAIISNVYESIYGALLIDSSLITYIFLNLPKIMFIFDILGGILLYAAIIINK